MTNSTHPETATDGPSSPDPTRVAVIGTGTMGEAMAANLVRAGLRTTVWDRSPGKVNPLVALGALPAEAAGSSDVVITRPRSQRSVVGPSPR